MYVLRACRSIPDHRVADCRGAGRERTAVLRRRLARMQISMRSHRQIAG